MTATSRPDGRQPDQLRPLKIDLGVNVHAEGSCLIEMGRTRVWITASVEDRVPQHRRGSGQGWITAEYSMLPRSTHDRGMREAIQGRLGGRTHEIQRLIGRSLRAAVDMSKIGERTITLDCDVLQADGGTRTASITGAFCALYMAIKRMKEARMVSEIAIRQYLAAVSCGIVEHTPMLVLATGNAGKLGEYRSLLAGVGWTLMAVDPDVAELGSTYAENAAMKAEAAREALGLPAVGDDSGVEVEVLKGYPGIHSARIALAAPRRPTSFFEGECRGEIIPEWRGVAGFGYDPVFLVPEVGRTFGEMAPEEKAQYSHRARAVRVMLAAGALEQLSV